MVEVSASVLNIEEENSIKTMYDLETSKIDYFHIDVMDGYFVENDTTNKMKRYCEYLKNISNLPLDVHLMVKDVESYISSFLAFEPNIITFHLEAAKNSEEVFEWIKLLKENNVRVGISVKPNTNITEISKYLPYIHRVLIMTVEPGKGGQELIDSMVDKVKMLKKHLEENNLDLEIEVDGGINEKNSKELIDAGADVLVIGSALVNVDNKKELVYAIKH